jgi:hypothetical protein
MGICAHVATAIGKIESAVSLHHLGVAFCGDGHRAFVHGCPAIDVFLGTAMSGNTSRIHRRMLIVCALRPPRRAPGPSLRWGVNIVFLSAIIAAVALEMV